MATRKKQLHTRNKSFWIAVTLFTITSAGTVLALKSNSQGAKERYDALIAADKAGGDVEGALTDLREFIYGHMNTTIGSPTGVYPPIQLKGTYDRLVAAEEQRIKAANSGLYDEATAYCEPRFPAGQLANGRVQCVADYVLARGVVAKPIPDGLYKFNFVSPVWSPDLAGFLLIGAVLSGIYFLLQILLEFRLRSHLRHIS